MEPRALLIEPSELSKLIGRADVVVVDASWYLPAQGRNAKAEFEGSHIPGAVFFDHDGVVDPASSLPHTLPSVETFTKAAGELGISETDTIVVYDGLGLFSAARAWWMFRVFGASDVRILDGGMPAWRAAGLPTESGVARPTPKRFAANLDTDAMVDLAAMRRYVEAGDMPIADARSRERFEGRAPEPRPGVRSGHMPGARSLPFTDLVDDGRLKSPSELRAAFAEAGIDPTQAVVTSCGSGVTAAVINFALASLGNDRSRLFDGSWTEWGSAADTPVASGPAAKMPDR